MLMVRRSRCGSGTSPSCLTALVSRVLRPPLFTVLAAACLAGLTGSPLPASAQAQTPRVPAKPEPVYRYLIVLDASFSMGPRSINLRNSVFDIVQSGFRGHIRPGEPFGLWTFNETVQIADFPRLHWDPLLRDTLARQSYEFLGSLRFQKQTRLDRAMRQIANLARDADDLVILLYTDGQAQISGTPFDAAINQVFAQRNPELRKERSPFVTALRVRQGQFVAHTVGASYDPLDIRPLLPDETAPPKPPTSDILIIRNENPAPTPPPTPTVVPTPTVARNEPKPTPPGQPSATQPPINPTPRVPAPNPTNPPPPPAVNPITPAPSPTAQGTQPSPSTPLAPASVTPAASPQPSPPPLSATPPQKPSDVPAATSPTTTLALPPTLPPTAPASPPPVPSATAPPVTPTPSPSVPTQTTSSSVAPSSPTPSPQAAVVNPQTSSPPPATPVPASPTPTASNPSPNPNPVVPGQPPTPTPLVAQANPPAPPSHLPLPIPERKPATLPGAGPLANPTNAVALAVGNPAGGGRGTLIALGAVLLLGAGTALVLMLRSHRPARSPSLISQSLDRDQH